jgi:Flp pilus assembly protein TadB
MAQRARIRASDADREHIAERLRKATAEGRLLAEELEERLGTVFSARTYGELDATVADLPRAQVGRPRGSGLHPWILPAVGLALLVPVVLAIIAAMLFIVTGVIAVWMIWLALGWWLLGHRRRAYAGQYRRMAGRGASVCARRAQARSGFWL